MYEINDKFEVDFKNFEFTNCNYINWLRCRRKLIRALNGAVQSFVSFLRHRINLSKFSKFRLRWVTWVLRSVEPCWPRWHSQNRSNLETSDYRYRYVKSRAIEHAHWSSAKIFLQSVFSCQFLAHFLSNEIVWRKQ